MMAVAAVFLPLAAAVLAALAARRAPPVFAGIAATVLTTLALAASLVVLAGLGDEPTRVSLATWIAVDGLHLDWSLRLDPLSALMLVVVNAISALVHLYAIGYMAEDPHRPRFFAFLSLFTFSMLLLVSADNFLQLFCGWEGVGLSSYLLIGFWYERATANAAAIKAFLMNRIGDVGLVLALAAIALTFDSLTFDAVFDAAGSTSATLLGLPALEVIGVLLLVGAMGKSAQIGLHTWLADAMEGPTPVSALLHAATMVTAGVFLVARCAPLYAGAPVALDLVAAVGAVTALFAATIALAQTDINRVVAWSTCSQLGYMFLAAGV
ncbi:MAG: NADH-quinone oxidoreductase subunit L, partial [Rhodospirillales bacterium]|nr:NADH-quinone oxidoreductase subunit L [Rhodospirillales bacterium]